MMSKSMFPLALAFTLASTAPGAAQERSYVGKKLPSWTFLDTEGHSIRPVDYEGAVLVMLTGIPW
jgi:hypothetical protein